MAFCNPCGNTLAAGARFCPKCGATTTGASAPTNAAVVANPGATSAAPLQPSRGNSAIKTVLVVVASLVILAIIGLAAMAFIAWRVARTTHVHQDGNNVRVETPFGTVESTNNPDDIARNLGIDAYPGSRAVNGNAASANFGGMHTISAQFDSDDPPTKVADFYKAKFPNANVSVADQDHYSIVSTDKKNLITINIEPKDGKTRISIANVRMKTSSGNPAD